MMHSRAVFGTSSQPLHERRPQVLLLVLVQVLPVVLDDVVVGRQQEAAGAAGRVADGVVGGRPDAVDDGLDEFARREVLPGPLRRLRRRSWRAAPRRCRPSRRPPSTIHFSGSIRSTISRRSVAGFWISGRAFLKISPSIPGCLPSSSRIVPVVDFQLVAFPLQQARPVVARAGTIGGGCTAAASARRPS